MADPQAPSQKPSSLVSNYSREPTLESASKRRRIGLACNTCRVRKSRCDGNRPSCGSCLSLGIECLYETSEPTANVIVRKDYISDLEQRVSLVENKLQRLNDVLRGHLSPCAARNLTPMPEEVAAGTTHTNETTNAIGLEEPQDEDASTNGMAMSFVEERSSAFFGESSNINFTQLLLRGVTAMRHGVTSTMDKDSALGESIIASVSPSHPYRSAAASSSTHSDSSPTTLPSVEEMDSLLDIYFDTAGSVFPFIHEETMRKTFTEFRRSGFTRARRTWLGTLNMIFAMASSFDRDHAPSWKKRFERSNVFYKRAIELCGDLSKRVISLEIVHYLLLGVMHCQGTQRSVQAWNNHGLAVRSAIALGLHTHPIGKPADSVYEEYRRRTWVVLYCLDKVLSVAFGRPAIIPDEQMIGREPVSQLPLPASDNLHSSIDIPGDFLAFSFRLYQVMGKSLTDQYAANLLTADSNPDDISSLKASSELRKILQNWAASLPSYLTLCKAEDEMLSHNNPVNRFRVILTMRYLNLGILVHKPLLSVVIRHLCWTESATSESPPFLIQLAMAEAHECVRAAGLTIDIVHSIISADPTSRNNLGAWYFTLYYVFTSSLVICARLLLAQHGKNGVDETAVQNSQTLLNKVETIFHELDHENSLVLSCLAYIRRLARTCNVKGAASNTSEDRSDAATLLHLASAPNHFSFDPATGSSETGGPFNVEDMEAIQLFSSEMFDPSIIEGFNQSPAEGMHMGHGYWEGAPRGSF